MTATMLHLDKEDPTARALVSAIQIGDVPTLTRVLAQHPDLAVVCIDHRDRCGAQSRSLLHIATDWPGHYPNGPAVIGTLVQAGADVNARFVGAHTETPLHWAASSTDVAVLDALIDAGGVMEAAGGVSGGGSRLADAGGFGQWEAARRLLERGARTTLTDAATLGLMDRVEGHCSGGEPPTHDAITRALWGACHGGQRLVAEYLLALGADVNWIGHGDMTPLDVARREDAERLVGRTAATDLVSWLRAQGAKSADELRRTEGLS
jgi:ankyrin repeat protein